MRTREEVFWRNTYESVIPGYHQNKVTNETHFI